MVGNTWGTLFRCTTWGESHGPAVGVVVDGCPAGLPLTPEFVEAELARRRPGMSKLTSPRREPDRVEILSGVFEGLTTGTPICLLIRNRDVKSSAYEPFKDLFRPGHADYTYWRKFGHRDWRGGGRASARETAARVAAGAVAKLILDGAGIRVVAYTIALGGITASHIDLAEIDANPLMCPDGEAAVRMAQRLEEVRAKGDSVGGIVEVRASGCPPGLGEPVFAKLDALLAGALMGIGAVKGVEIGSGFRAAAALGSENNDPLEPDGFASNNAGGVLGGISTGQEIVARVAVKPIPSIEILQRTITTAGEPATVSVKGRHDVAAIPRIVPVCEAMVRLVLADLWLQHRARSGLGA